MALWVNVKRVTRYGFSGFSRNMFVSLAAILIMCVTLFMIANILLSNAAMKSTLHELTEKVDVTVYFRTGADEASILDMGKAIEKLPQVAFVKYVSPDDAIAEFRERHKNDELTLQALDQLADNPLGASLEVRAKETSQYESIAKYLEAQQESGTGAGGSIDKINYAQNKTAIDRLTAIIASSERNDAAKAIVLAVCSLLIAFNTIRLAIYTARDEIGVMNLVGAGHWYVRGPFMVTGILYGVISAAIVLALLYPLLLFHPVLIGLDATSELLFGSFDSFAYFTSHFVLFLLVLLGTGVALGVISSFLAVRRYLHT